MRELRVGTRVFLGTTSLLCLLVAVTSGTILVFTVAELNHGSTATEKEKEVVESFVERAGQAMLRNNRPALNDALTQMMDDLSQDQFTQISRHVVLIGLATMALGVLLAVLVSRPVNAQIERVTSTLRDSENRFRSLFECSRDAIMTLSPPNWKFSSANPAAIEMFRVRNEEEFVALGPWQVSPEYQPDGTASADKARAMIEKAVAEGSHHFRWRHKRLDGVEFSCTVTLAAVELDGQLALHAVVRDVTERDRHEQRLRQEGANLRAIFDAAQVGMVLLDEHSEVTLANDVLAELVGEETADLIGGQLGDKLCCVHAAASADGCGHTPACPHCQLRATLQQAARNSKPTRGADAAVRLLVDGQERELHFSVSAAPLDLDSKRNVLLTIIDVTELKQREQEQAIEKQRAETLLSLSGMADRSMDDVVRFAVGQSLRFTTSSAGYFATLDSDQSVLTLKCCVELAQPSREARCEPIVCALEEIGLWGEAVRRRKPTVTNQREAIGADPADFPPGLARLQRHLSVPVFDGGRIVAVAGVGNSSKDYTQKDARQLQLFMESLWEILERKSAADKVVQAQEAATQESLKLRTMIEGMAEGVVFADENDIVTEVNEWFLRKIGRTRDALLGQSMWDFHPGTQATKRVREMLDQFRRGECRVACAVERDLLGMSLSLRVQPVFAGNEYLGVILNVIDVTDIVEARREAEAATRIKSEFLANMSHEIRTPMTAILGFTDLLLETIEQPEALDTARIVKRNGEHLLELINDILDLAKVEAGKLEFELNAWPPRQIVSDVVSLLHVPADAKGLTLNDEYEGPLPETIVTDPSRLRQILINIVGNAIKFTESGGVRIVTRLDDTNDNKPRLCFDVIDTGVGIPAEQIDRLFEAFAQADSSAARSFEGTGLGLTISRRFAQNLGGDITVTSELGKGSVFTVAVATGSLEGVRLVEYISQTAPGGKRSDPPVTPSRRKLQCRVLVVDDVPDNRLLISSILREAGAEVEIAENGQEAIDKALASRLGETRPRRESAQQFDVVLMDIAMPVLDGYETTRRLRQESYQGPIVSLTASAMHGDRQKCLDAGCNDYMSKPVDRGKLVEMVAKWASQDHPEVTTAAATGKRIENQAAEPVGDATPHRASDRSCVGLMEQIEPAFSQGDERCIRC